MTYTEFITILYNFVDSIYMVYITAFFAFTGLTYSWSQVKKYKSECSRLNQRCIELEKKIEDDGI